MASGGLCGSSMTPKWEGDIEVWQEGVGAGKMMVGGNPGAGMGFWWSQGGSMLTIRREEVGGQEDNDQ